MREQMREIEPPASYEAIDRWRDLQVMTVEPLADACADAANDVHVRACVALGGLLPADVRVELVPGGLDPTAAPGAAHRLWSAQSFHNDRYAFEGILPRRVVTGRGGFTVRITVPRAGDGEPAKLRVFPPLTLPHAAAKRGSLPH